MFEYSTFMYYIRNTNNYTLMNSLLLLLPQSVFFNFNKRNCCGLCYTMFSIISQALSQSTACLLSLINSDVLFANSVSSVTI